MRLDARAPSWFSRRRPLTLDGRPFGQVRGRFWTGTLDADLPDHQRVTLRKSGLLADRLELVDTDAGELIALAQRGALRSTWRVLLSAGDAQFGPAGFFRSAYHATLDGRRVGVARRNGFIGIGWTVEVQDPLGVMDALLLGLIFQIVQERRQHDAASAT